jgi:hypothetical protein
LPIVDLWRLLSFWEQFHPGKSEVQKDLLSVDTSRNHYRLVYSLAHIGHSQDSIIAAYHWLDELPD